MKGEMVNCASSKKPVNDQPTNEVQKFAWPLAVALSVWCLMWLAMFAKTFIELTWKLACDLNGISVPLLMAPCFWTWCIVFAFALCVVHRLSTMPWQEFRKNLNLSKAAVLIAVIPALFWMILLEMIPYIYPAVSGSLRIVPILGGPAGLLWH